MEKIKIEGKVTVYQGDGKDRVYHIKECENSLVDAFLKYLTLSFALNKIEIGDNTWYNWGYYSRNVYLGTDTAISTTHGMTSLQSPIGTAPGTAPDSKSMTDLLNPSTGRYEVVTTAVWNPGTVSGIVGELAYYLGCWSDALAWQQDIVKPADSTLSESENMVARLAEADTEFDAFTIDPSKSLTVEWTFGVDFA